MRTEITLQWCRGYRTAQQALPIDAVRKERRHVVLLLMPVLLHERALF